MSNSRMQAPHLPTEQQNSSQAPAPVNLPPIHHFPPQQPAMQSQPPSYTAPMSSNGAPPPQHPQPYPPPQYQYQNGVPPAMQAGVAGNGQNGLMRIPLPHAQLDSRHMSGGRHKKEIKRRTKTGCLTCRKRRIKCDEGQPTCRNCFKSKRECLGYDPIFKSQSSPANIQPAPTGNPASSASHPGAGNPYHQAPQTFPGTGGTFIHTAAAPGTSAPPGYAYASLDPALSSGDPSAHMAHSNYPHTLQMQRKVRVIPMEDLFALNDIPPRYDSREARQPLSPPIQEELETFIKYHYVAGLDRVLETTWYSQRGWSHLQRDPVLLDFVAQCAEQFKQRDEASEKLRTSLEARIVWQLATMPRTAAQQTNGAGVGADPLLQEVLARIDVLENLLTGQFLDPSRIPPPPQQQAPQPGQEPAAANQKYNERSFWHHLGRFVSLRDDTTSVQKEIDDTLNIMRNILSMLENRDVLYSIAIGRHIGGRMPDFHPQRHLVASNNDPNNPVTKLSIAHSFVESEDQRGTTQVIQRICSMAIRGWILSKR
ncbi:putative transcriptional regulatory protein C15D4.02 [Pseudocercospora fuligena]|uniref:Putative transcriptional regulatory protein C15D4.02 n=1 Tax=Pseudocercospora fuligena TaxID=685502 RepID=A0A8H6VRT3_9PEZI|nr:putative transcriptional regulatory protein C15D4.02 [Pseudocercospora fuligena]